MKHDALIVTTGSIAARGLVALGGLAAARYLGPSARGSLALAMYAGQLGARVLSTGLPIWLVSQRAVGRWPSAIVRRHVITDLVVTLVALVIVILVVSALGGDVGLAATAVISAFTGGVLLICLAGPIGARAVRRSTGATLAGSIAFATVTIAVTASGVVRGPALAAGLILSDLTGLVVLALTHRREQLPDGPLGYADAVRAGSYALLGDLTMLGMARADLFLVALFLDTTAVGLYAVALSLADLVGVLADAGVIVLQPRAALGRRQEVRAVYRAVIVGVTVLSLLLAVGAQLLIGPLLGDDWERAASLLWPLGVGSVALAIWKLVTAELAGRGETRIRMTSAGVALFVMVAGDLILIPPFGLVGAAVASSLAAVVAALIAWSSLRSANQFTDCSVVVM